MESTTRRRVLSCLSLVVGTIAGFMIGYAAMSFRVVATSPIGLNVGRTTDPFQRVFVEMARLGEAEVTLRSCANRPPSPSTRETSLRVEDNLIRNLREDSKSAGLTPPLDVADDILKIREDARPGQAALVDSNGRLASTNLPGWPENSESVLREALLKMDRACKR